VGKKRLGKERRDVIIILTVVCNLTGPNGFLHAMQCNPELKSAIGST
jgi:hypothetical protein